MKNSSSNQPIVVNDAQTFIQIDMDIASYVLAICNHLDLAFGSIEITMLSKDAIEKMNHQYFQHPTPTDTISFNLTPDDLITGDIYICPEIIQENTTTYTTSFEQELKTVLIHSILHLMGYTDDTEATYLEMKNLQETIYQNLL